MEVKCPHCVAGKRKGLYTPEYDCEDCEGSGRLRVCAECGQPSGPRDFEEVDDDVCGYCKANTPASPGESQRR